VIGDKKDEVDRRLLVPRDFLPRQNVRSKHSNPIWMLAK
jgi:hypothetical protein